MRQVSPFVTTVCSLLVVIPTAARGVSAQEPGPATLDAVEQRALLNAALPLREAERDEGTQYMIIDWVDITSPASPTGGGQVRAGDSTGVTAFLRSLGESTGPAFQLQMGSDGPVRFSGTGIVVVPVIVRDDLAPEVEARMTDLASKSPVTQTLNGYCLQFQKGAPAFGQVFRIAPQDLQDAYRPAANILEASRQMEAEDRFEGETADYVHSIKQWALWVAEDGDGDEASFSDAFVAHAKDNYAEAGLTWTAEIEAWVRSSTGARWALIQTVHDRARELDGGIDWPDDVK